MSCLATLKMMLEVILFGVIGPNATTDYVDPTLLEKMGNKRKSNADFEDVPKKNKITKSIRKFKIMKSKISKYSLAGCSQALVRITKVPQVPLEPTSHAQVQPSLFT